MKKQIQLVGALCLFTVFAACKKVHTEEASVTVRLSSSDILQWSVFSVNDDIYFETTKTDSVEKLDLKNPSFLTLKHQFRNYYVFLKPQEQVVVDTIANNPMVMGADGEISAENAFLNWYMVESSKMNPQELFGYYAKEPDSFEILVKRYNAPLLKKQKELQATTDFDARFKDAMLSRIQMDLAQPYFNYEIYYQYANTMAPELPEGFYEKTINSIDLTDPIHLNFQENLQSIKSWMTKDISFADHENVSSYFGAISEKLKDTFGESLINDYYQYQQLAEDIDFGKGIDASTQAIDQFKNKVSNIALNGLLNKTVAPWEALKAGKKAPDFEGKTPDGRVVTLEDLKGKRIYIDVWATWCKPCINEIPALQQLEEELKGEAVQFVSISIDDEKNREKWAAFVAEKELGGVQLMTDGDWNSDLSKNYNITGIPRFMIIDAEGNMVNANAPRPSDPLAKELLTL